MSYRIMSLASVLIIVGLLLFSIYLQFYKNILPCPLCTLQRITFIILAVFFLFGCIFYKKIWQRIFFSFLTSIFSIIGLLLAGRQVWLQHFPSAKASECGVNLSYMMQVFSPTELIGKVLEGTADCAKIEWEFLHFDMAEWALVWFFLFLLISLYSMLREFHFK